MLQQAICWVLGRSLDVQVGLESSGWPFDQGAAVLLSARLRASCLQSVWTQPKTSLNPQTHMVLPGQ